MTIMFCGHSQVFDSAAVRCWLQEIVADLLEEGAELFYHGGYGQFDLMAAGVAWNLKKEYPNVESILVLPYLDRKVDTSGYDGTTYPPLESVPRKYAISRRNRWLVENSDVVVAYVTHGWGGAATTLKYAQRKGLRIIQYHPLKEEVLSQPQD